MSIPNKIEIDGDELDRRIINKITMNQYNKRIDGIKSRSMGVMGGPDAEYNELNVMFNEIAHLAIAEMIMMTGIELKRKPPPDWNELAKMLSFKGDN